MAPATVPVDQIETGQRLRQISEAQVEILAASIAEVGLLNPVTVYPLQVMRGGTSIDGYGLVAGAHRLEAFKRLGLIDIPVHTVTLDDLQRQIAECDENLCSTTLSKSERAMFVKRRKDAYEALHPQTKHGGDRKSDQVAKLASCSDRFTSDTAAKTGQSERSIQRDANRGMKISDKALATLRGTTLDTGVYLDSIKDMPHREQLARVKEDLADEQDRLRKNGIGRRVRRADPLHEDESKEKWLAAGMSWWNRAPQEWRDEFLAVAS